jgi:hypothetical protein
VSWYKLRALSDVDTVGNNVRRRPTEIWRNGLTGLRNQFSVLEPAREEPGNRTKS